MRCIPISVLTLFIFSALMLSACGPAANPTSVVTEPPAPTQTSLPTATVPANPNLILATTTSTQDSGLLDVLIPAFETQTGFTVQILSLIHI